MHSHDNPTPKGVRFRRFVRKVRGYYQSHGKLGTLRYLLRQGLRGVRVWAPGVRARSEFDERYGVDTDGFVQPWNLRTDSPNVAYSTRYLPMDIALLERVLGRLPIRPEDYAFIDIGSGKGRALMVAARHPFRAVIGVEFGRDLHEAAVTNLRRFSTHADCRCLDLRSECVDATLFSFPPGPFALCLFNPFEPPVLDQFLDNLERTLLAAPRPGHLLYLNPVWPKLLQNRAWLEQVEGDEEAMIFRVRPEQERAVAPAATGAAFG